MNFINRLLVIVELFVLIVLMPIAIVLLLFFLPGIPSAVDAFLRGLTTSANLVLTQLICIGLAALIFGIAIVLLFLELQRPTGRRLRVPQVTDGQVEVTEEAIIQRLEHSVLQVADVLRVKARAATASKGAAVDLFLEIETSPEVNVPQKTQEVIGVARQVLEQQMGLKVGKVQVRVGHGRVSKKQQAQNPPPSAQGS